MTWQNIPSGGDAVQSCIIWLEERYFWEAKKNSFLWIHFACAMPVFWLCMISTEVVVQLRSAAVTNKLKITSGLWQWKCVYCLPWSCSSTSDRQVGSGRMGKVSLLLTSAASLLLIFCGYEPVTRRDQVKGERKAGKCGSSVGSHFSEAKQFLCLMI